jgi:hypothetical protein
MRSVPGLATVVALYSAAGR